MYRNLSKKQKRKPEIKPTDDTYCMDEGSICGNVTTVGSRVAPEIELASDYCKQHHANDGLLMYDSCNDCTDNVQTTGEPP